MVFLQPRGPTLLISWSVCIMVISPTLAHFPDVNNYPGGRIAGLYPFQDPTLAWDKRVDDLVGRLTLDELVNQTITIYGKPTYGIPRLGVHSYVWIAECLRGEVGYYSTAFPQSLGLAAAFSGQLIHDIAEAVSNEVRAHWNNASKSDNHLPNAGISCFSPVINIMRHPLWGRNQETYGEDPHLSSVLAQSFVHGLQGQHPRYVRASAGCKHFDVHGGPENIPYNRFSFDAKVSTRDWRMTFLPAFRSCIEAGTYSLMCSYNSINGVPACANGELLTNITRKELGFTGYVVSDDLAVKNIYERHHYTKDAVTAAAASMGAGCNLELGSEVFSHLPKAVSAGLITEDIIRQRVKPLMYTRMRLGEFDPPSMNPYTAINMSVVQSAAHQNLALTAAMQSFVLLKNEAYKNGPDKTLPLTRPYKRVAIVGPMSDNVNQLYGDYASKVNTTLASTPWKALQALAASAVHADGCSGTRCSSYNSTDLQLKVKGSDLVIICLGTGQALESEGNDRAHLDLPGHQLGLLKDAATIGGTSGATVIVLLFNAGPLDVTWAKLSPHVHAMLECFFPAQATGAALLNTLRDVTSPDAVPAARLPATWPAYLGQVPPISNYTMKGRTYRYYEEEPLYPFGYGLSYTTFKYSNLSVTPQQVRAGDNVTVTVTVTNTGKFNGDEVVQFYLQWPSTNVAAPKLQLVAFQRVRTQPQQSQTVKMTVTGRQMAVWVDDKTGFKTLPGTMTLYGGGQQPGQTTVAPSNVPKTSFMVL